MIRRSQIEVAKKRKQVARGRRLKGKMALFTRAEVEEIRRSYVEDIDATGVTLAKKYGASAPTIHMILRGEGAYPYPEDTAPNPNRRR
jgi:hypothetical protein